jgi:hypothetical protein
VPLQSLQKWRRLSITRSQTCPTVARCRRFYRTCLHGITHQAVNPVSRGAHIALRREKPEQGAGANPAPSDVSAVTLGAGSPTPRTR